MKKEDFLTQLNDDLDLDNPNLSVNSSINLTSLRTLSLVAFLDEKFKIRVKAAELKGIDSVDKIIRLIGEDKIE